MYLHNDYDNVTEQSNSLYNVVVKNISVVFTQIKRMKKKEKIPLRYIIVMEYLEVARKCGRYVSLYTKKKKGRKILLKINFLESFMLK